MGLAKLHDEEPLNSGVINILPNEAKYNSGSNWQAQLKLIEVWKCQQIMQNQQHVWNKANK